MARTQIRSNNQTHEAMRMGLDKASEDKLDLLVRCGAQGPGYSAHIYIK
jgi:hypothetical protein